MSPRVTDGLVGPHLRRKEDLGQFHPRQALGQSVHLVKIPATVEKVQRGTCLVILAYPVHAHAAQKPGIAGPFRGSEESQKRLQRLLPLRGGKRGMVFQDRERQQQHPDEPVDQRGVLKLPLEPAGAGEVADLMAEHRHQHFVSGLHGEHPDIGHYHHIGPVARSAPNGFLLDVPVTFG